MSNRVFVMMEEGLNEPEWFSKTEPFLNSVMEKLNFSNEEVSVMFSSDNFIRSLNLQYRNIDSATDVLSFENDLEYEDGAMWKNVGDIVVSLETLSKNAEYFEVSENLELKRLLIHGILHLNGYDHGEEHIEKNKEPECEMLKIQENLLKEFKDFIIISS